MSRIDAADYRGKTSIRIRGGPDDLAEVTKAAARYGLSANVWAREILINALEDETGWADGNRRKAVRRPNRQPRPGRQGDPPGLTMTVSAAEHEQIKNLTARLDTTITDWAWGAIRAALEKES